MVQPASVDLRLGNTFRVFHNHRTAAIDLAEPPTNLTEQIAITDDEPFVIHPGEFVLGRTLEWVELPDDVVARIEGKSSLGRLGLIVHATAGFVDPGWKGTLTLEITNLTRVPIKLWAAKPIAQLSFMTLDAPGAAALRPPRARQPLPRPGRGDREPLRGRPGRVAHRAGRCDKVAAAMEPDVEHDPRRRRARRRAAAEEHEKSETPFFIVGRDARGVRGR